MTSAVGIGCWCGVLEAGSKSSPVVRDPVLLTGKEDTIYLFNLNKKMFLEYRKDIVEAKLRELNGEELEIEEELLEAFKEARKGFTPRALARPPVTRAKPKRKNVMDDEEEESDDEIPDFPDDEGLDLDDTDDDDHPSTAEDDDEDDDD